MKIALLKETLAMNAPLKKSIFKKQQLKIIKMFLKKKDNKNEVIVVKDIKTLPKMKKLRLAEYRKKYY